MQFESVMSMMRYIPPNGTAGLARSRVSGHRRSPWPPARSTPMASRISDMGLAPRTCLYERVNSNSICEAKHKQCRSGRVGGTAWLWNYELLFYHYLTACLLR